MISFDAALSCVRSCARLMPDGLSLHPKPLPKSSKFSYASSHFPPLPLEVLLLAASIPLSDGPILQVGAAQCDLSTELLRRLPPSSYPLYVLEENTFAFASLVRKFQNGPIVPLSISLSEPNLPLLFHTLVSLSPLFKGAYSYQKLPIKLLKQWFRDCTRLLAPAGTFLAALPEHAVSLFLKTKNLGQFELFPVRYSPEESPFTILVRAQKEGPYTITTFDGLILTSNRSIPLYSLEFQLRSMLSVPLDWSCPPLLSSRLPLRPHSFLLN